MVADKPVSSVRSLGSLASVEDLKSGRQGLTVFVMSSVLISAISGVLFGFDSESDRDARDSAGMSSRASKLTQRIDSSWLNLTKMASRITSFIRMTSDLSWDGLCFMLDNTIPHGLPVRCRSSTPFIPWVAR